MEDLDEIAHNRWSRIKEQDYGLDRAHPKCAASQEPASTPKNVMMTAIAGEYGTSN